MALTTFSQILLASMVFFLTTKYIGKSEESTSLFERAASSNIKQNSLSLVWTMWSETVCGKWGAAVLAGTEWTFLIFGHSSMA